MNVLLDIASLVNKGDWLMFEAMLEQVRTRCPMAKVGVPEPVYNLNPCVYAPKGVVPVINPLGKSEWVRKMLTKFGAFILRRRRPLFSEEIDLVLFSPGFRFSDQFEVPSERYLTSERRWFESFRKPGHRFFFMPQAFGPFSSEVNKNRLRRLFALATHIYAREKTSYESILPLLPDPNAVSVSPDFTCMYKGEGNLLPFDKGTYVVVIPNRQMLVRASDGIAGNYCEFMLRLVRHLKAQGENIVLLNHEGGSDIGLIEFLNASINNTGHAVCGVSGGVCKSVIAGAKLVVTSRFHGLVSAGVPTLCTSWSHKYQELVTEMDSPHSCDNLKSVDEALRIVDNALQTPERYTSSVEARAVLKRKVLSMWDEILPMGDTGDSCGSGACERRRMFYVAPRRWEGLKWLAKLPFKLVRKAWNAISSVMGKNTTPQAI